MTTTTVASALESALRPIAYQLDNALAVTEGVAASSLQAAKTLLEQVTLQVLTQYDKEIDEFNSCWMNSRKHGLNCRPRNSVPALHGKQFESLNCRC
ncbi:hypothetical protein [Plesiomonas shigelloides]|uniref:hypothetical protein n=1 Tax=Plesiomonas shigelloides TaxID=703 RepID=UPI001E5290EB|nr:hypothetical protein [Plesiomonas shigelloides]